MVLRLALKSLAKYRRRTFTVFFSVLLSVIIFVFTQGFIDGFRNMLMDALFSNLGHVTIQHSEYEKKADLFSIDYLVSDFSGIVSKIEIDGVKDINGELRFAALLSSDADSIEMVGRGVEIEKEYAALSFRNTIKEGTFLVNDGQIIVSKEIARLLDVAIGNRLMVLSTNSFGGFDVIELELVGFFDTGFQEENENIFLISLRDASKLLKLDDTVSFIEIKLADYTRSVEAAGMLDRSILTDTGLAALPWEEKQPDLKLMSSLVGSSMAIMFIIILAVVSTGIINSILMSIYERFRDFGTIRAIGVKKRGLFFMIVAESTLIGVVATAVGVCIGGIITILLSENGVNLGAATEQIQGMPRILYPEFNLKTVIVSLVAGISISAFGAVLPALSASKLKIVDIMRHT